MDNNKIQRIYEVLIYNSIINRMPVEVSNFKFLLRLIPDTGSLTMTEKQIIADDINNMSLYNQLKYITDVKLIYLILSKIILEYNEFELLFSKIYTTVDYNKFNYIVLFLNGLGCQIIKYVLDNDDKNIVTCLDQMETIILMYGSYNMKNLCHDFKKSKYSDGLIDKFNAAIITKKLSN